jgi:flagellar basal body P-ring formation protein FlgA
VERGQLVYLLLEDEGLNVKMTGVAQDDGGMGDRVRIQNQESKKIVSAVVVGNARVELK